jgi:allophycocyanin-B
VTNEYSIAVSIKIMSVVSQVILSADDELRYPTIGELMSIKSFLQTGERRMQIAQTLADNEKKIVDKASKELWRRRPDFIAPGGNAFGQKQRALCLRDYGWYLRLVTYSLIAGDKGPIESIGLIGVREMYNALNVPVPGMVEAIRCLRDAAVGLLSGEDAEEAAPYFDYIIQAMS